MTFHVVVGAGPTGTATALQLAATGHEITMLTRRGTGPDHPRITLTAGDAADPDLLTSVAEGAATIINCAAPPYHRVPEETPALSDSLIKAATRTGAGYLNLSNAYGLGPVDGVMTEDLPLRPTTIKGQVRARMYADAMAAHAAGDLRFAEVRPGDYLGAGAVSTFNLMVAPALLAGDPVVVPADLDVPHSWAYTGDVARALATIATDPRAWGHVWHPPVVSYASLRELADRLARIAELPPPTVLSMSPLDYHRAAIADPIIAETVEVQYLCRRPAVTSTELTARTSGLEPAPLGVVLRETVEAYSVRGGP